MSPPYDPRVTQVMMTESVKLNPMMAKQCKPLVAKYVAVVVAGGSRAPPTTA